MRTLTIFAFSLALLAAGAGKIDAQVAPSSAADAPCTMSPTGIHCQKRDARRHHDTAVWLADAGRTKEAIDEDSQAIACDPNHPGYQILMGRLLVENGELTKALACYQQVYSRYPDVREAISELVFGLQATVGMMNLECVRNAPEIAIKAPAAGESPRAAEPSPRHSAAREVLHRLTASGYPAEDPTY